MRSGVLPSFWDRLKFGNSSQIGERAVSVSEFEKAVLRDVEMLLNERRPKDDEVPEIARATILGYGLPDLTTFDLSSPSGADRLAITIRDAIQKFEPRLHDVAVSVDDTGSATIFRVRADVHVEPATERLRFEAVITPGTSQLKLIY